MAVLLLAIFFLMLLWQLVKVFCKHRQKHQQLILAQKQLQVGNFATMQEKNQNLLSLYNALGHSIAALNIQLLVAQKLWQVNPSQAQESLSEAYQLSGVLMREVRQVVRSMSSEL
jgi:hypothetical protein